MPSKQKDRISELIGPLDLLSDTWKIFIICILGFGISAWFTTSLIGLALCWWGVGLLLLCMHIERPWLNVFPLPPLTTLQLSFGMKWSIGGLLLLLARGETDVPVWRDYIEEALPINALLGTLVVLPALFNYIFIRKRFSCLNKRNEIKSNLESALKSKQVLLLCLICGGVASGYLLIGLLSGTLDRGAESYFRWASKIWRPDTLFSAVIRLRDLYYILLPAVFWRWKRNTYIRTILLVMTVLPLTGCLLLGSRGIILYPLFLLICGCWLAGAKASLFRNLFIATTLFSILFVSVIGNSRLSFDNSSRFDIGERISIIFENFNKSLPNSKMISMLGRELYASSDPHMFKEPGLSMPERGFQDLKNLPFIWVPKFIYPEQPEVLNDHIIAGIIEGAPEGGMEKGIWVTFPSITMSADLYSRFRWPGVVIGGLLFGIFYTIVCRVWYKHAFNTLSLGSSVILGLFPATFLQGPPAGTIMKTAWVWGYEIPKYILVIIILVFIIESTNPLRDR